MSVIPVRLTPTGQPCTNCRDPDTVGYHQTNTMCSACYEQFVVRYQKQLLERSEELLAEARRMDERMKPLEEQEF